MFRCCVPDFCSSPLIGLYLLCTACASHRARSSFFLNKGKGIGSPICRAAPRGCRRPCTPSTNTARAQGRGIKGGEAPFAGGPGTRRFLAYLCLLSLREKVGRGAGRSARIDGCRGCQLRMNSRGWRGGAPSSLRVEAKSNDLLRELCSHTGGVQRGHKPPRICRCRNGPLGRENL